MTDKNLITQQAQPITLDPGFLAQAKDWEDFVSLWMISKEIDVRNQWYKGDIADRVAVVHGESSLNKFAIDIGEPTRTIEHYRRVSRAFRGTDRNFNLSWTHYLIASFADSFKKGANKFDGNERLKWAERANDGGWSTTRLTAEIKKSGFINDQGTRFDYWNNYFDKLRNMLMHIEKDSLTNEEKEQLIDKLATVLSEFEDYLTN